MRGKNTYFAAVRAIIREASRTLSRPAAMRIVQLGVLASAALLPQAAHAEQSDWVLDPFARVETSVINAKAATRDDEIVVDGDALTFRLQAGVELENETTKFRLEADRIEVVRLGSGRNDTNRDRLTASVAQKIGEDWEIRAQARAYDDLVTAEFNDTDERQGAIRITYQPERAHRFRLEASWREREYDRDAASAVGTTHGSGPRIDADYRHRFGRYHYLAFDLRAEEITSDDAQREYTRQSAKVSYTHPINSDLRVRPAVEVLRTQFSGRFGDDGNTRSDRLVVPEVEMLWWPDKWRIEAEAKYIFSDSNELTRQREGYRLTLSVGHVF